MTGRHLFRCGRMLVVVLAATLLCTEPGGGFSLRQLTAPLATALLLCWPTTLLPNGRRQAAQIALGELTIVVCLVDAYCLVNFGCGITPQIYSTTLQTNAREVSEFVSQFVTWRLLGEWRIAYLLLLAVLLPLLYVPWLSTVPIVQGAARWWGRGRWAQVTVAVVCGLCLVCEALPAIRYMKLYRHGDGLTHTEGLVFSRNHEAVPTPQARVAFAMYAAGKSRQTLADICQATFAATVDSAAPAPPRIVLVIGESFNKHHASLYGYPLPTTPLLSRRMADGELALFTDVVSPWNITSNVFVEMFSVGDVGRSPLFPVLYRRAGYRVAFFSNQYLLHNPFQGPTNELGHFFLSSPRLSDSLFDYRNSRSSRYDMGMVRQVADWQKANPTDTPTLDIIHLLGQHFAYSERYPDSLACFTPGDYAGRNLSPEAARTVAHYDNATRYQDHVLDSIIRLYRSDDAVVVFLSDHGEEVYDMLPVHGRQFQRPTVTHAAAEFEVPMWIWSSSAFRIMHPNKWKSIRNAASRPLISSDIPQLLLGLAGISGTGVVPERNVLTPGYRPPARIIAGQVDYDTLRNTDHRFYKRVYLE